MKSALLVIDMQQMFYDRGGVWKETYDTAIQTINAAISLFESKNLPVYKIYHKDESYGLLPGTEGFEFHSGIKTSDKHKTVLKTYGNAFNKTDLDEKLKADGVTNLVITGYCAEYCVLSTTRGAIDKDYTASILRGAIASGNKKHIKFVEDINEVMSLKVLELLLK